jgi:hypothetical protein
MPLPRGKDSGRITGYADVIPVNPTIPLLPACRRYIRDVPGANGTSTRGALSVAK